MLSFKLNIASFRTSVCINHINQINFTTDIVNQYILSIYYNGPPYINGHVMYICCTILTTGLIIRKNRFSYNYTPSLSHFSKTQ